ncbi:MAG: hypothetical protein RJS97_02845 [Parvibaculaceae bacterium]
MDQKPHSEKFIWQQLTSDIVVAFNQATNIVALFEMNLDSYFRIKERLRASKEQSALDRVVRDHSELRMRNHWILQRSFDTDHPPKRNKGQKSTNPDQAKTKLRIPAWIHEFEARLEQSITLLEKHADTLTKIDHTLVRNIRTGIEARREVLTVIAKGDGILTPKRMQKLKQQYETLVQATDSLLTSMQVHGRSRSQFLASDRRD